MKQGSREQNYSTPLVLTALLLTSFGLLAIYASSSIPALQRGGDSFAFFRKQSLVALLGFAVIYFSRYLSLRILKRMTLPILLTSISLLALVMIPALQYRAGHATRWLKISGFTFQPAEIAKLAMILFLARNLSRATSDSKSVLKGVLPNFIVYGVFAALIMMQPDFGTTALLFIVTFLMVFAAGASRSFIVSCFTAGLIGAAVAVAVAPYRLKRLTTFLDPFARAREGGYQIIQSFVGFQNGGLLGAGLGESKQKLFFLPEAHTDFILAVIGEELGLVGVLLICSLFTFLTYLGAKIATQQTQAYQKFLAFGLTSVVASQAIINMGVAMGLLPTKGIPLPFVSNGPTCLLVFLTVIALLARLAEEPHRKTDVSQTIPKTA